MPVDKSQATALIKKTFPEGKIQAVVEYKNLYLFQVFGDDPLEGELDPFYSVNKNTGELKEFSILTDAKPTEILPLFVKAKGLKPT